MILQKPIVCALLNTVYLFGFTPSWIPLNSDVNLPPDKLISRKMAQFALFSYMSPDLLIATQNLNT